MRRLNILYVSLYLPLRGIHGGGNRLFEQIKYLSDKYDIYLISFLRDWEESGLETLRKFCKEIDTVRIEERKSKSYSLSKPGFIKNYYSGEMAALIQKKIKDTDFDIVQFEYLPMAQYRDGLNVRAKTMLVEHQLGYLCLKKEMDTEKSVFKKSAFSFRYNRLLKYENKVSKKFDKVIFVSATEAAVAKYPNSFVSPMGVDTEYFKPVGENPEDTDLIYTGNFDNYQNVDSVIYFSKYIWPLIVNKRPETNMRIIGVNSKEKLGFLKDMRGIEAIGRVEDIRAHLGRAKVFIAPARIGGGMKGKILEALSMGKPVVSTSIGAEGYEGEVLKTIKIEDSPEGFADKILEFLYNKDLRKYAGFLARRETETRCKWEHIFSDMDKFYKKLCVN